MKAQSRDKLTISALSKINISVPNAIAPNLIYVSTFDSLNKQNFEQTGSGQHPRSRSGLKIQSKREFPSVTAFAMIDISDTQCSEMSSQLCQQDSILSLYGMQNLGNSSNNNNTEKNKNSISTNYDDKTNTTKQTYDNERRFTFGSFQTPSQKQKWLQSTWKVEDIELYLSMKYSQFRKYKLNIFILQRAALKIQHWFFRTLYKVKMRRDFSFNQFVSFQKQPQLDQSQSSQAPMDFETLDFLKVEQIVQTLNEIQQDLNDKKNSQSQLQYNSELINHVDTPTYDSSQRTTQPIKPYKNQIAHKKHNSNISLLSNPQAYKLDKLSPIKKIVQQSKKVLKTKDQQRKIQEIKQTKIQNQIDVNSVQNSENASEMLAQKQKQENQVQQQQVQQQQQIKQNVRQQINPLIEYLDLSSPSPNQRRQDQDNNDLIQNKPIQRQSPILVLKQCELQSEPESPLLNQSMQNIRSSQIDNANDKFRSNQVKQEFTSTRPLIKSHKKHQSVDVSHQRGFGTQRQKQSLKNLLNTSASENSIAQDIPASSGLQSVSSLKLIKSINPQSTAQTQRKLSTKLNQNYNQQSQQFQILKLQHPAAKKHQYEVKQAKITLPLRQSIQTVTAGITSQRVSSCSSSVIPRFSSIYDSKKDFISNSMFQDPVVDRLAAKINSRAFNNSNSVANSNQNQKVANHSNNNKNREESQNSQNSARNHYLKNLTSKYLSKSKQRDVLNKSQELSSTQLFKSTLSTTNLLESSTLFTSTSKKQHQHRLASHQYSLQERVSNFTDYNANISKISLTKVNGLKENSTKINNNLASKRDSGEFNLINIRNKNKDNFQDDKQMNNKNSDSMSNVEMIQMLQNHRRINESQILDEDT